MNQIPEFFQYAGNSDLGTTLQPFSYNAEDKSFVIAEQGIELGDFDPYGDVFADLVLDLKGIDVEEVGKHPLYIPIIPGSLIVTPSLHEWAENNVSALSNCWEVIRDAYNAFGKFDSKSGLNKKASTSHIGFASGLRETGGIHLQTMGNCACMGPRIDGNYFEGRFEYGYGEYDMHNADTQQERASLFAGMGHLARLCAES